MSHVSCPHCKRVPGVSEVRKSVTLFGRFFRACDKSTHQRYRCKICRRTFSKATTNPCCWQKKRYLNPILFEFFSSGMSQRRIARIMRVDRKTVVRKLIFLGEHSELLLKLERPQKGLVYEMQFDDLETFEHSKLKPLSVTVAVEKHTRRFLGFRVSQMPAKGLLVKRSLRKYGYRKDERKNNRDNLFEELKSYIHPQAIIESDSNPHYEPSVKKYFPFAKHVTFKGRRGCVTGQGELKEGGYDPLFSLNHSFAMMRANINRLFRRTWNTTKVASRLHAHIAIYCLYHNKILIPDFKVNRYLLSYGLC